MPRLRRRAPHLRVVESPRETKVPDVERLVHHAVQAGDADTVVEFAPRAGRDAGAAGSHRQALAHLEAAVAHVDLLPPVEQARLGDDYSWELYIAYRFAEALAAGRDAVRHFEQVGDPVLLGEALVRLSRHVFVIGDSDEAEQLGARAMDVLRDHGAGPATATATATTHHGVMLTLTGQMADAVPVLRHARVLAVDCARPDLESLGLTCLGLARAGLGQSEAGEADLREGWAIAMAHGSHEAAARAHVNLGEMMYSYGNWTAFADNVDAGLAFAEEHGLGQAAFLLALQRNQLLLHRGDWDTAESGLRELVARSDEPSMFDSFVHATYGRLLARRGRPEAEELLGRAWHRARTQRTPLAMSHAGRARVEWAWLSGRREVAQEVAAVLLPRMQSAGWSLLRGELLRYLARAGVAVEPFDGCPEGYAAGLRGYWRAAAVWERAGDPYERATGSSRTAGRANATSSELVAPGSRRTCAGPFRCPVGQAERGSGRLDRLRGGDPGVARRTVRWAGRGAGDDRRDRLRERRTGHVRPVDAAGLHRGGDTSHRAASGRGVCGPPVRGAVKGIHSLAASVGPSTAIVCRGRTHRRR